MADIVIGLGFGDEGKGLVTDYLCRTTTRGENNAPTVVRFSGGHQAGHTVCVGDVRHVFSNFGSGTLRGARTYFKASCVIDPIGIMNEYRILCEKGVKPVLLIDPGCAICTPYDKYSNEQDEEMKEHGTCGLGVYTTIRREKAGYHLQAEDMEFESVFKMKLAMIQAWYEQRFEVQVDMSLFNEAIDFIMDCQDIHITSSFEQLSCYKIYEGSQGIMLDERYGFFPHVTATKLLPNGNKCQAENLYMVTRAYCTRHGNGPMPNNDNQGIIVPDTETNQENKYQGKLRTCILDMDMLKYAKSKVQRGVSWRNSTLVITCLDHLHPYTDEQGKEHTGWRLVDKGEVKEFSSEKEFVEYIANKLWISRVLLSHSPYSDFIEEVAFERVSSATWGQCPSGCIIASSSTIKTLNLSTAAR